MEREYVGSRTTFFLLPLRFTISVSAGKAPRGLYITIFEPFVIFFKILV